MNLAIVHSVRQRILGGMERALLGLAEVAAGRGDRVTVVCRPGADFGAAARTRDLPVEELPLRGDLDLPSVWKLRHLFGRHRTDAAVVTLHRDARTCGLARAGRRLPAVALVKGIPLGSASWPRRLTYRRFVDGVIAPTAWLRDDCLGHGFFEKIPVRALPDGIDPALFPPLGSLAGARDAKRAALGVPGSRAILVSAGHLVRNKNFAAIPGRLARLGPEADWEWWLAGDGPDERAVHEAARIAGVKSRVKLLGRREDVPGLLLAADALLVPSFKEQLPLVALEAVRAGVPHVLVSAVGAEEEMRSLGVTLLGPSDEQAWERELSRIVRSPGLTREPREWARDLAPCAVARLDFLQELVVGRAVKP